MNRNYLVLGIAVGLYLGCDRPQNPQPSTYTTETVQTQSPLGFQANRPTTHSGSSTQAKPRLRGKIVETMNAGGYTYVGIAQASGTIAWAAGPETPIQLGREVDMPSGLVMTNFESKSLGRTFDQIYFLKSLRGAQQTSAPNTKLTQLSAQKSDAPAKKVVAASKKGVSGVYTVAQLFAQGAALNGQVVKVKGKVVKFSPNIMGKNWLHLQDGTGNAANKNNDLVVTTKQSVAKGDQVLVSGILTANKDFGAGYSYAVIVEEASLTLE